MASREHGVAPHMFDCGGCRWRRPPFRNNANHSFAPRSQADACCGHLLVNSCRAHSSRRHNGADLREVVAKLSLKQAPAFLFGNLALDLMFFGKN